MTSDIPPEGPVELTSSDESPPTEPRGSLVPPARRPPTTIGAASGEPPWRERLRGTWHTRSLFARAVEELLDVADTLADTVAARLGLRE